MFRTLPEFLAALEAAGELHRVRETASPLLEIAQVADRHSKSVAPRASRAARRFDPDHCGLGGRALLFERVQGCDLPLCINAFGSYHRMEMALGCAGADDGFARIARRIEALVRLQPPRSLRDGLRQARDFLPLLRLTPRLVRRGRCQQVVQLTTRGEVDLSRLPLIKCWPLDGDPRAVGYDIDALAAGTAGGQGRYITFAGMHTIHADDADAARPSSHNIGMYRAQLLGPSRLAMHWHMHHDGAAHWRSWKAAAKPMPIAICLGGESVMPYAATAPLPPGLSELLMAGFLNGRGIPMVRARTVPLRVPANCELVIEGWVSTECGGIDFDPDRGDALGPGAVFEGPFGDHTGFYSMPDRYPVVEVTAITRARDAIFPAIIVGYPPQEDYYLGKATERVFLPLLRTLIPDLLDYHLPLFGSFHNCALVSIRKAYPLQARRVMHAVWGAGQMSWTKLVVVVDQSVDVHDERAVLEAVFHNAHFARDLEIVNGPLDILDHAAPRLGAGHKMGIDATPKWPGEEVAGIAIDERPIAPDASLVAEALAPAQESEHVAAVRTPAFGAGRCVFVAVPKERAGQGAAAIEAVWKGIGGRATLRFVGDCVVAVDAGVDLDDTDAVLFHLVAQFDPGRDLHRRGHRVGFDATTKMPGDERNGQPVRRFPPLIVMDQATRARVSDRAAAFGLSP